MKNIKTAINLYKNTNIPVRLIAKRTGISSSSIYEHIKKNHVRRRTK